MNIDINLILTISSGILLAYLVKHIINVGFSFIFGGRNIKAPDNYSGKSSIS